MNPKQLSIIIIFLLVLAISSLLIPSDESIQIQAMPRLFSIHQTSVYDSFMVPIYTTNPDHDMWDNNSIIRSNIHTTNETIAIDIVSIEQTDITYEHNTLIWTVMYLEIRPSIEMNNKLIEYEEPILELIYPGMQVSVPLGGFGYSTINNKDDIVLSSLEAVHGNMFELDTITGIKLSLYNKTKQPLTITSYDIVGKSPVFNPFYMRFIDTDIKQNQTIEEVLGIDQYNAQTPSYSSFKHLTLNAHQEQSVLIPLQYQKALLAHRVSICITYELKEEEYLYCIDDFPFIEASVFQESYIPYLKEGTVTYDSN